MRILLIAGHSKETVGAVGNGFQEWEEARKVCAQVKRDLEAYGVEVHFYNPESNKNAYDASIDFKPYQYVLEIHFNAGGGHGTEIYVTAAEQGKSVETGIVKAIEGIGFRNRGVKVKDFHVIKRAKNQGISSALLELCFIDSAEDMKHYKSNFGAICKAIAGAVAAGFGIGKTSKPTTPPAKPALKSINAIAQEVVAGKWGNDQARKDRLRAAGYDPDAVQKEVNRIMGAAKPAKKTNAEVAKEVSLGLWGNGQERKDRLRAAGYDYDAVQRLV